jgi:hypothetical protein
MKLAAEGLGTFALVFAGTGAVVINDVSGGTVTHVGVALTFGLVILAMIYAVGDVSGAHLNPVVRLGFFDARRFETRWVDNMPCRTPPWTASFSDQGAEACSKIGRSSASRMASTSTLIRTSVPTTRPAFSIGLFQFTPKSWRSSLVVPVKPTRVTWASL